MTHLVMVIRNLNFTVQPKSNLAEMQIQRVIARLTTHKWIWDPRARKNKRVVDREYLGYSKVDNSYRFNINMLKDFMLTIANSGINKDEISINIDKKYSPLFTDIEADTSRTPRDYQLTYIEELVKVDKTSPYKLVDLQTGKGKTYIAVKAISELNMLTMVLVLPKFIDKWISDVIELTNCTRDEIYVIKGGDTLRKLLVLSKDEISNYKFIITSLRTIQNYIKEYESINYLDEFSYDSIPSELTRSIGVGIILNDESHMDFFNVFKATTYLDAYRFIGLSATLVTKDKEAKRMQDIMFPSRSRISNIIDIDRFLNIYAVSYKIYNINKIQHRRQQGYNHNLFETSLMRSSKLLANYTDMILYYLKVGYKDRKKRGEKCVIFVASVNYATYLTNVISRKYKKLNVKRYVEDDPYDNIINGDITVTTILSAGTGLDIPDLLTVIQTISISSPQANLQTAGRLRKLPNREVRFYYLYCMNIDNHNKTNKERIHIFRNRVESYNFLRYDKVLDS